MRFVWYSSRSTLLTFEKATRWPERQAILHSLVLSEIEKKYFYFKIWLNYGSRIHHWKDKKNRKLPSVKVNLLDERLTLPSCSRLCCDNFGSWLKGLKSTSWRDIQAWVRTITRARAIWAEFLCRQTTNFPIFRLYQKRKGQKFAKIPLNYQCANAPWRRSADSPIFASILLKRQRPTSKDTFSLAKVRPIFCPDDRWKVLFVSILQKNVARYSLPAFTTPIT